MEEKVPEAVKVVVRQVCFDSILCQGPFGLAGLCRSRVKTELLPVEEAAHVLAAEVVNIVVVVVGSVEMGISRLSLSVHVLLACPFS